MSSPRTVTPREAAYHEAGHAAMCCYLGGRPIVEVLLAIDPRRGTVGGKCCYGPSNLTDTRRRAVHDILLHVAGRAAQARYLGREPSAPMLSDAAKSVELARGLTPNQRAARWLVVEQYRRARSIIANIWPAVAAIAEALLDRGRLEGREAHQLAHAALVRAHAPARPGKAAW